MKKFQILLSLFISTLVCGAIFAAPKELKIEPNTKAGTAQGYQNVSYQTPVLKGGISQVQELPTGMYGMWQVKGTLLETNDYSKYATNSSDIWVLRKDGDFVTLMNPQNGASATITVTEVKDNTATFTRGVKNKYRADSEEVTITLQGDTFYGTDFIVSEKSTYGIKMTTVARYKINGTKISGESLYKPNNTIRFKF